MAKQQPVWGLETDVLLTPECELWQSLSSGLLRRCKVLLTPECELWQSQGRRMAPRHPVLLTPECELWQSIGAEVLGKRESC